MSFDVGSVLDGKVVSIMPFGAFVSLPDNKSGLVHISEVAGAFVQDINEHLKIGDVVKVKVIKVDDSGKISLSIKKAIPFEKKREKVIPQKKTGNIRPANVDFFSKSDNSDLSFEDKLNRFKQDSDEKIQALKRSNDSKRSGGYRRGGGSY